MKIILIFRTKESTPGIQQVRCNVKGFPKEIPIGEVFTMKMFSRYTDSATAVERTWEEEHGVVITCEVSKFLLNDLKKQSEPVEGLVDCYQLPDYTWLWGK